MVTLPGIFSDGMVIGKKAKIFGNAEANEIITVKFMSREYKTTASEKGEWSVYIETDSFGGPYTLSINDIIIKDVLVGLVWLAGGQSNMELPIKRVRIRFEKELKDADYPFIRAYNLKRQYNFTEPLPVSGDSWICACGADIDNFYAAAYFFAVSLWREYKIPVGIIGSAVGGSKAEAWISEEALAPFDRYIEILSECKRAGFVEDSINRENNIFSEWRDQLNALDYGLSEGYQKTDYDDTDWRERNLLKDFASDGLDTNGSVWFRRIVEIPPSMAGKEATLFLGVAVDSSTVYVNGMFAGCVDYRFPPGVFKLPAGTLQSGVNLLAVRLISRIGKGGFVEDKPYKITAEDEEISLEGLWKYKKTCEMPAMEHTNPLHNKPVGLYNGMIAALNDYILDGVIFYQGESNAGHAHDYRALIGALVNDWRKRRDYNFPFIFTQLANFEAGPEWADLRFEQLKCLDIDNTAMASAVDCGEYNDLHPTDKKTVGERLALAAKALCYGAKIEYMGPIIDKAIYKSGTAELSFTHTGLRLKTEGDALGAFECSDNSGVFRPATARLCGNKVIVDGAVRGCEIRYAWSANPKDANLYNNEGLPASPFKIICR